MSMTTRPLDRQWVTVVLAALAVPNLVAGVWGVVAPANWYDQFPGWAPHLVAAYPPFNDHLAADAAAGLLAMGVAALVALVRRDRLVVLMAMIVVLAFALPHAVFHLRHPSDLLTGSEQVVNNLSLVGVVLGALVVGAVAARPADLSGSRHDD